MLKKYIADIRKEFSGYNAGLFTKDLMAGLTVTAVALPLALAFGVSSGATAAAGLVTAILAGIIIGGLSGASFQISGPTGAMTAIMVSLVAKFGMQGVFTATAMAGIILLICAALRLGSIVAYIPAPVITGFTSGIAIIIALGQLDNFFGVKSVGEHALSKLASYFTMGFSPNLWSVMFGALVIAVMVLWPKKWNAKVPSSLAGIALTLIINMACGFDSAQVPVVGDIPKQLLLDERLTLGSIPWDSLDRLISPAVAIAALGLIESLLCGACAGRMKGEKLNADRELFSQGIGNLIIPFFGGVPATAAIARTSVAIKAGLQTRLTSIIHALGLIASMFLLADVMSRIPLSALSGVLLVTAWRMNEWESIKHYFRARIKTSISQFIITMAATVVFDLTVAIAIGIIFSVIMFVISISDLQITVSPVEPERLGNANVKHEHLSNVKLAYITGPIFFCSCSRLEGLKAVACESDKLILSMRGVPVIDASAAQTMLELVEYCRDANCAIVFCSIQPKVKQMLDRAGVTVLVGESGFHWDAREALCAEPG